MFGVRFVMEFPGRPPVGAQMHVGVRGWAAKSVRVRVCASLHIDSLEVCGREKGAVDLRVVLPGAGRGIREGASLLKTRFFRGPVYSWVNFKNRSVPLSCMPLAPRTRERKVKNAHTPAAPRRRKYKTPPRVTVETRERPLCSYNDVIYTCRPLPYIRPYVCVCVPGRRRQRLHIIFPL